jgi:hypothetical protein
VIRLDHAPDALVEFDQIPDPDFGCKSFRHDF